LQIFENRVGFLQIRALHLPPQITCKVVILTAMSIYMKMKKNIILFTLTCTLLACSPSSSQDFREVGRSINRSIIKELHGIHSHDELVDKLPVLENLFGRLTEVMISARKFEDQQTESSQLPFGREDQQVSDLLRLELNRVYRLPGGKGLIERAQRQALDKLDKFEQTFGKQSF
jgi:hypothetical protein